MASASTVYTTRAGDTWDSIAYRVYGDELKADVIMRANEFWLYLLVFPAGVQLTCPAVDSGAGVDLPAWRR